MRKIVVILLILLSAFSAESQTIGVNFRNTSGFVTDGANETYSLCNSDVYPTNRATYNFGRTSGSVDSQRDREATTDRRLAGVCQRENNLSPAVTWRIDLGGTSGQYDVSFALGDFYNARTHYFKLLASDNSTVLININGTATTANQYIDASGTLRSNAAWVSSNTKVRVTNPGTTFYIQIGQAGADAATTSITHINFQKVASFPVGAIPSKTSGQFIGQFSGQH